MTEKIPPAKKTRRAPGPGDLGQTVRMRLPHTCGAGKNRYFRLVRLGERVRLRCLDCEKLLEFSRERFLRDFRGLFFPKKPTRTARRRASEAIATK